MKHRRRKRKDVEESDVPAETFSSKQDHLHIVRE
jgi:hypothetical protein